MERAATRRRFALLALVLLALALLGMIRLPAGAVPSSLHHAGAQVWHGLRNAVLGPPTVGIQIGHLASREHPEELAELRFNTGGEWNGVTEVEINRAVAQRLAGLLEARGVEVHLLPATVPPRFRADLLIAIHADSNPDPSRRGYKSAVYRRQRNEWDAQLKALIDRAYLSGSGLPDDDVNVSGAMLDYYAFNRRFRHSVARGTPAVIVELGYLSNPADLRLLSDPGRVAELLEVGITDYLLARGRLRG